MPITCCGLKGRKITDIFLLLCQRHHQVLDVRYYGGRPAWFSPKNMRELATNHTFHFETIRELGNPSMLRKLYQKDPPTLEAKYRQYLRTLLIQNKYVRERFQRLRADSQTKNLLFLCACHQHQVDKGHCHTVWLKEMLESNRKYWA